MLEFLFRGLIEWLYGLILEAWEYFSSALLDIMSMDFVYLESHMTLIPVLQQAMLAVGWALLLGNLVFQAAKSMMTGLGFEGEDPKLLFTRTFVFSFLLLASPQICSICLNMTAKIINIMEMPKAVNITIATNATFAGLSSAWLLTVICGIIVMFQSLRLIFEVAERYFILAMLTICAPVAFGMGGSRNTSDLFSGWCRMYGSMCILMVLNVVFIKMLLSVLSFVPSGIDVLPWMVLVLTIVKVAKKADAIVARIGLTPAITGDSLGRVPGMLTYMVARTAVSSAAKAIGKGANGGEKGGADRSPSTPPGGAGGGAGGYGAISGMRGAGRAGSGANTQQKASYTATQQSAQRQEASSESVAAQFGDRQSVTREQSTPAGSMRGSQFRQGGSYSVQMGKTRNTFAPSGTRRAPSHIGSHTASGTSGEQRTSYSQSVESPHQSETTSAETKAFTAAGTSVPPFKAKTVSPQNGTAGKEQRSIPGTRYTSVQSAASSHSSAIGATQRTEQSKSAVINRQENTEVRGTAGSCEAQSTRQTLREARPGSDSTPVATVTARRGTAPVAASASQEQGAASMKAHSSVQSGMRTERNGMAGNDAASPTRQTLREPRQGGNTASAATVSAPKAEMPTSTPARQEGTPDSGAARFTKRGETSFVKTGTAGTAQQSTFGTQQRQSARPRIDAVRNTTPLPNGLGEKKLNSLTGDTHRSGKKNGSLRKTKTKRKGGGKKHG